MAEGMISLSLPVILLILLLIWCPHLCSTQHLSKFECSQSELGRLYVNSHVTPWGNQSAGLYKKVPSATDLKVCVRECCHQLTCHTAFHFNGSCFLITCLSDQLCDPLPRTGHKFDKAYMIKVRSADEQSTLTDIEKNTESTLDDENMADSAIEDEGGGGSSTAALLAENLMSKKRQKTCVYGLILDCPVNEHCETKNSRARQGICQCSTGFVRDPVTGICQQQQINIQTTTSAEIMSTPQTLVPKHLTVSAGENRVIYLPENAVTLSAYALPKPPEGQTYKFSWTLLSHPGGDEPGLMEDQNTANLKLSKLQPGVYTFNVSVTGPGAAGESQVNVTVMPAKHANKPPVAVIQPDNVTVQLPNRDTVLDGSFSKDYDQIVKYHWESVAVPIGYSLQLNDTPTLQLKNLIPGFYKFKLTVTDTEGASNFTFANVTVLKESDYPPTANAGDDIVIFLPKNEATLNGNLSKDDKGIKSWQWQWMKEADSNLPVDVEGTNSPFLHLSHLAVGVYKFQLKVTDTADQTSTAEVRVFVKPENNKAPVANVGSDQKVSLPLTGPLILDGSASNDDLAISKWLWVQTKGPKPAKLEGADQMKLKVTSLVPGDYTFQLTVFDAKGSNGSASVNVFVTQMTNSPPRAVAGGDKTVFLPCDVVILNGSASSDDVDIVSYKWTRETSSLAVGDILEGSANKPVLKLSNLIPGRYLFRLTVTDAQGTFNSDTTSLIVKDAPDLMQQVEIVLNADIKAFTQEQLDTLLKQLELLVHDTDTVHVNLIKLSADRLSRRVTLIFVVQKGKEELVAGTEVVTRLKHKLRTDGSLLNLEVLSVHTVVCQNLCSGHGSCDPYTKHCVCEAFWMEDFFRLHLGDQESNCDWSVLYVIIVAILLLLALAGAFWASLCLCSRAKFQRAVKRSRYMLLDELTEKENSFSVKSRGKQQHSSLMASDSDSDTVFESRHKSLLNSNSVNGLARKIRA